MTKRLTITVSDGFYENLSTLARLQAKSRPALMSEFLAPMEATFGDLVAILVQAQDMIVAAPASLAAALMNTLDRVDGEAAQVRAQVEELQATLPGARYDNDEARNAREARRTG